MLRSANQNEKEENGELIWSDNRFFPDQRVDFNMSKKNFPENALVYIKQGTVSTIKGELDVYVNCFVLG